MRPTRDTHHSAAALLVLFVMLPLVTGAVTQAPMTSVETFASAPPEARLAFLNLLAKHEDSLTPAQLVTVLADGVKDSDPGTRAVALTAFASRAGSVRFNQSDGRVQRWRGERPALMSMKELVTAALKDPDARVRATAILALGNLEYQVGDPPVGLKLSEQFLRTLSDMFESERSVSVRAEIAGAFAWCSTGSMTRANLLLRALDDPSPEVLTQAARGVARMRLSSGLLKIVALITHDDRNVRLVATQSVAEYGADAFAAIEELRAAAVRETDPLTRKTLEGTIAVIEKKARP